LRHVVLLTDPGWTFDRILRIIFLIGGFDMKKLALRIYDAYQYIFDSSKNPLRHIPDPPSRMFIMIILATLWSGAFAIYLGSIIYFGISVAAHIVLLLMFFFTMAVFYDAEKNKSSWLLRLRKEQKSGNP
tara:strand:+ start:8980 stop:9369 length:390 start_codon:yes stop_codon:yes gene_type:complete